MGLLSTEAEIGINGRNMSYYENLGYEIPRMLDNRNRLHAIYGAKIKVPIKDLSKGSSAIINIECDCCGKQDSITYNNYQKTNHNGKIYCKKCATKLFYAGENHPNYKKEKTPEERERKRLYPENFQFIKEVLARDNYTCQCCGISGGYLEVHHLDGYDWCIEKRTDNTNGITLCDKCHSNFHALYGRGGNTKEQFEEWIGYILSMKEFNIEISPARKIYCYEENRIYNGATEFIRTHGIKSSSTVYFVCNRVRHCKTIKGMHLFWYDEYVNMTREDILKIVNTPSWGNSKKVVCLTTNTIYESIAEASRKEQASETTITRCCDDQSRYAHTKDGRKTQWIYYDELELENDISY